MRRLAGAALGVWAASESIEACASRLLIPRYVVPHPGPHVLLVLGFHNPDPARINAVNRWRAEVALRSLPSHGSVRIVVSGGVRGDGLSEAALIGHYLKEHGVDPALIVLEQDSLSTWENVLNSRPLMQDAATVTIVSNPLHAFRARWYLRRQDPDLARRLTRAADHRIGEHAWAKPVVTAYGLRDLAIAAVGLVGRDTSVPPRADALAATRRSRREAR